MSPIAWDANIATVYETPSLEETAAAQNALNWTKFDEDGSRSIILDPQLATSIVESVNLRSESKSLRSTCEVYGRALRQTTTPDVVCNLKGDPDDQSIYVKETDSASSSTTEQFAISTLTVTIWEQWIKSPFPIRPVLETAAAATQLVQSVVPSLPDVTTFSDNFPDPVAVQYVIRGICMWLFSIYVMLCTDLPRLDARVRLMFNVTLRLISQLHWIFAIEAEGEEWQLSCFCSKGNATVVISEDIYRDIIHRTREPM